MSNESLFLLILFDFSPRAALAVTEVIVLVEAAPIVGGTLQRRIETIVFHSVVIVAIVSVVIIVRWGLGHCLSRGFGLGKDLVLDCVLYVLAQHVNEPRLQQACLIGPADICTFAHLKPSNLHVKPCRSQHT